MAYIKAKFNLFQNIREVNRSSSMMIVTPTLILPALWLVWRFSLILRRSGFTVYFLRRSLFYRQSQ